MTDQFRNGYVSGLTVLGDELVTSYDLRIFFGDSGSGIFNSQGALVGVISSVAFMTNDVQISFACSRPLAFTPEQLREVM